MSGLWLRKVALAGTLAILLGGLPVAGQEVCVETSIFLEEVVQQEKPKAATGFFGKRSLLGLQVVQDLTKDQVEKLSTGDLRIGCVLLASNSRKDVEDVEGVKGLFTVRLHGASSSKNLLGGDQTTNKDGRATMSSRQRAIEDLDGALSEVGGPPYSLQLSFFPVNQKKVTRLEFKCVIFTPSSLCP